MLKDANMKRGDFLERGVKGLRIERVLDSFEPLLTALLLSTFFEGPIRHVCMIENGFYK